MWNHSPVTWEFSRPVQPSSGFWAEVWASYSFWGGLEKQLNSWRNCFPRNIITWIIEVVGSIDSLSTLISTWNFLWRCIWFMFSILTYCEWKFNCVCDINRCQALNYIVEALSDPCVRTGHRLDILNRGNRILSSKKIASFQKRDKIYLDNMNFIPEARHVNILQLTLLLSISIKSVFPSSTQVTIFGHQLQKPVPSSGGSVWLLDKDDFKVMSRVEQFAMEHYSEEGYPEGRFIDVCLTRRYNVMLIINWKI